MLEHALHGMALVPMPLTVVVLGAGAEEVVANVDLHHAEPVVCERWEEGQAASLACGLAALLGEPTLRPSGAYEPLLGSAIRADECEAVVVALGDQPRISPEAIRRVIRARDGAAAVRATYNGRPGHPVVLERELFERLRDVTGDHGARNVLMSVTTREVPCDDLGGGEDVDTRAQLDALRAGGPVT
jgi:molybdenum cofactor cytidylyltransferase